MSEKTVAARIKMARRMASLHTQASLLEKIPQWSASRLGNYEAGISMPGPDDILLIAEATASSPCWLMFGLGPIRPNERDLQAIRHQNLTNRYQEIKNIRGGLARLAKSLGLNKTQLEEQIENPFQPISDQLAALFEASINKPAGWMDEQHVEHDPLCLSFPADIQELIQLYSGMKKKEKHLLLALLKTMSELS
ncbi:MAG: DNA-binding protein [gamma proteobacterium symbiont of Bathyaustriella thionipta]|nr:DNA-binding protein [gamma proteobacterium symbiont of Bathyaustriella thionipta]